MATKKLAPIRFHKNIQIGCDPEFFFADAKSGKVVGSEKVLSKDAKAAGLIIDGVQAELNPAASYCREILANNISNCFKALRAQLDAEGKNIVVRTDSLVDISQAELNSLSEGCQVFGCMPSTNIYDEGDKKSKISVDPKKYLKRSAGGHIHMGNAFSNYLQPYNTGQREEIKRQLAELRQRMANPNRGRVSYDQQEEEQTQVQNFERTLTAYDQQEKSWYETQAIAKRIEHALMKQPETVVAVLDIVVGNTCVLIDRSAGNAERRANYGRAGEFRVKPYGVEYRPLSNFWLRSYQLMSFVTGLCRFAIHIVSESTPENDYVKALFDAVKREDIVKAINTNDRTLALQNFKNVQELFKDWADEETGAHYYPIRQTTLKFFYHFILRIKQKGLEYWFPDDAMTHWCGSYKSNGGWEKFVSEIVSADLSEYAIDLGSKKKKSNFGRVMSA